MKGLRVKLESGWQYNVKEESLGCCSQLRGPSACHLTLGWGKMRFTCTSSACSPRGPSASVTVQSSSFEALQSKQKVSHIRNRGAISSLGGPAPYAPVRRSEPANVAIAVLGAERNASEGEASQDIHGFLPSWVFSSAAGILRSRAGSRLPLGGSRDLLCRALAHGC